MDKPNDPGDCRHPDEGPQKSRARPTRAGWERTGMRFLAYDNPAAGTSPVCRFFFEGAPFGSSHFYSASPAECATVVNNPQTYPGCAALVGCNIHF